MLFLPRVDRPNRDHLLGLRKRERPEQDRVDHTEDGGVPANAERERQHGDDREAGLF